ncbi:uncharacterized protein LOC119829349 [Zerene cesonia]|uniref:uncharacterized protein LOC119829349 n=1 Tax=Zerene cesonia TaxID=33412 RepID=UPI0018E556AE|nr:uncharacterized protein LOC119829349 [Zerene cesonia]
MEEESIDLSRKESPFNPICKCFLEPAISEEGIKISFRKEQVLNTVVRTETYLRERRIPELIRFLLTKLISQAPSKPIAFLEKLIDECMLFRAGHGSAPVLYESRHLEAVIKSFDPCQRGWLSTGQVRRLYTTLGLVPEEFLEERVPVDIIFKSVKSCQEKELYDLLVAGTNSDNNSDYLKSDEVCIMHSITNKE